MQILQMSRASASVHIFMKQRISSFMRSLHALIKFPNITFLMANKLVQELLWIHRDAVIFLKKIYLEKLSILSNLLVLLHFQFTLFFFTFTKLSTFLLTFSFFFLFSSTWGTCIHWIDVIKKFSSDSEEKSFCAVLVKNEHSFAEKDSLIVSYIVIYIFILR